MTEITRNIQQQTGVEENEVIIKSDYRTGIAIGWTYGLLWNQKAPRR